jgi:hypothetical protein
MPVPLDPNQIIRDAVIYFVGLGYSIVGDPASKSFYMNGVDIVAQKFSENGKEVIETNLIEVKQTIEVTKGTLGLDKAGNYGGSIDRAMRTADRLTNTSNSQLSAEFKAIEQGRQNGTLTNSLFTTAKKVTEGVKEVFNNVYMVASNGVVTGVKSAETFAGSTVNMPFLAVPYQLIDPKNSPFYNPQIPG